MLCIGSVCAGTCANTSMCKQQIKSQQWGFDSLYRILAPLYIVQYAGSLFSC